MKNKKGFTLIELLAIIVILAIIAVITVPLILGIIDEGKKGAAIDSAYGYKNAVETYYAEEQLKNPSSNINVNGDYTVDSSTGNLVGTETLELKISGDKPTGGEISINNNIVWGCLEYGEYRINLDETGKATAIKGKCGAEYYAAAVVKNDDNAVYYDPGYKNGATDNPATKCTREQYLANLNASTPVKTGCMRWWAYSEQTLNDGTLVVNLILDHNTSDSAWANSTDYTTNPSGLGITYTEKHTYNEAKNNKGPQTLLKNLKQDTQYWQTNIPSDYNYTVQGEYATYSIDYGNNNYKARIITSEEISKIVNKETITNGTVYLDFPNRGPNTSTRDGNAYSWLLMNTSNCETWSGCKDQTYAFGTYGFWTTTASQNVYENPYSEAYSAYYINFTGASGIYNVVRTDTGIRPVISVPKSSL